MNKTRTRFVALLSIFALSLVINEFAPVRAQGTRAESEPLIRAAVYESALATLTGDPKLYRSRMARRTLELYRLIFEGFKEVPDYAEMLTENKLDTVDKFIDTTFKQGATQWANLSKDEIEQRGRAQSNGKLIFLGDREVILQFGGSSLRLVYEDNAWKVDETEAAKKPFLDNFQFTPATRAKIEKL